MTATNTNAIVDGAARVIAGAVAGTIFAAGVTDTVTGSEPRVVPLADDFTEVGLPIVTVALTDWKPALQPGNERLTATLLCAVWRERFPLGQNVADLYADRDAIAEAWIAHSKNYLEDATVQSAVLMGGPGIVAQELPSGNASRTFLTLPFSIEIKANRTVLPQPA